MRLIPEEEFFEYLQKNKKMLDGVVITGGEPTMSPGLIPFMRKIKEMGFAIKLDSNGTRPEILKKIIEEGLIEYIAVDFKAPFHKYATTFIKTSVSPHKIKETIDYLKSSKIPHEFRTTLYPDLTHGDLLEMAEYMRGEKQWFLQHFQPKKALDRKSRKRKPMDPKEIRAFAEEVKDIVKVSIRE